MLTMIANVHGDTEGFLHPDDLDVLLLDGAFSITHEDEKTGKDMDICVSSEHQAQSLIVAIKAMCAALGWKVKT